MVVRVNGIFATDLSAEQLHRAMGDYLIDVHIRLRARSGLPHEKQKLAVQLSGDHLISSLSDSIYFPLLQMPFSRVHYRGSFFYITVSVIHLLGHMIIANSE